MTAMQSFVLKADRRLLAVLHAIESEGPQRFTDLASILKLRPGQINRALKILVSGRLLVATIEPGTYPNKILYDLTPGGKWELNQVRARIRALKSVDGPTFLDEAEQLEKVLA
jgi:DNA-binding PadR family transcriptional regulator